MQNCQANQHENVEPLSNLDDTSNSTTKTNDTMEHICIVRNGQ